MVFGVAWVSPKYRGVAAEQAACLSRQRRHHRQRQALTRMAVRPGADAVHAQAFRGALRRPGIDRFLAGAIRFQALLHEHR